MRIHLGMWADANVDLDDGCRLLPSLDSIVWVTRYGMNTTIVDDLLLLTNDEEFVVDLSMDVQIFTTAAQAQRG